MSRIVDGRWIVGHDYGVHRQTRPFALWPPALMIILLGCAARIMLLVIIATIVCGRSTPSRSAWTPSAGRRLAASLGLETELRHHHRGGSSVCLIEDHSRCV